MAQHVIPTRSPPPLVHAFLSRKFFRRVRIYLRKRAPLFLGVFARVVRTFRREVHQSLEFHSARIEIAQPAVLTHKTGDTFVIMHDALKEIVPIAFRRSLLCFSREPVNEET